VHHGPQGCSLLFPTATQTDGNQSGQTLLSQNPTGVKLQRRLIVKHGFWNRTETTKRFYQTQQQWTIRSHYRLTQRGKTINPFQSFKKSLKWLKSVRQLTMKGSLLPLFSGKSTATRTKGTAINLRWIHCELQTFKRNKNKHILHTNWCEIHSSDLWSFWWSEIILTQLAEFGLYTKRAEMLRTRNYTGLWFLLHVMRGEKEK